MGGREAALKIVAGHVEGEQVKREGGLEPDRLFLGEVRQVHQGRDVLVEIDIGVPLGKPEPAPKVQPPVQERQRVGRVLPARQARVAEHLVREELPGQEFRGVKEDLMVLDHQHMVSGPVSSYQYLNPSTAAWMRSYSAGGRVGWRDRDREGESGS